MRRSRKPAERWGEPRTYPTPEGATVTSKREYIGYGFQHYEIVGTPEQIVAAGAAILASYPTDPYSTIVYWPPEKFQQHRNEPVEVKPGVWRAYAWHSCSSD